MKRWVVIAGLQLGCGHIGFDPTTDARPPDGPVDATPDQLCLGGIPMAAGQPCTLTFGDRPEVTVPGAIADTTLYATFSDANFGAAPSFHVDNSPVHLVLLRIDLQRIPPTAIVSHAELRLWGVTGNAQELSTGAIRARAMAEAWVPGTLNGVTGTPNFEASAPGMPWTGDGGRPRVDSLEVFRIEAPTTRETEVTTALDLVTVQQWIARPGENLGLLVTSDLDGAGFSASESPTAERRPLVRVTFVP